MLGDPGQTHNTSRTLDLLRAKEAAHDLLFLLGDFSYADSGYTDKGHRNKLPLQHLLRGAGKTKYPPLWDTFGRLFEPTLSALPMLHINGAFVSLFVWL